MIYNIPKVSNLKNINWYELDDGNLSIYDRKNFIF